MAERPTLLRTLALLLAAGVLAFVTTAVWKFHPHDWPSHAAWPYPESGNPTGQVGAWVAYQLHAAVGLGVWPVMAAFGGWLLLRLLRVRVSDAWLRVAGTLLVAAAVATLAAHLGTSRTGLPEGDGGIVGLSAAAYLTQHFGTAGARLGMILCLVVGLLLVADELLVKWPMRALGIARKVSDDVAAAKARKKPVELTLPRLAVPAPDWSWMTFPRITFKQTKPAKAKRVVTVDDEDENDDLPPVKRELRDVISVEDAAESEDEDEATEVDEAEDYDVDDDEANADDEESAEDEAPTPQAEVRDLSKIRVRLPGMLKPKRTAPPPPKELGEYNLPDWEVLDDAESGFAEQQEAFVREKAAQLEEAFGEFGVDAHVVAIDTGPVITMYEISVAKGTKVSAITSLSNDIARALAAESIRIVAPIPGKNTIGIEVPNAQKEKVRLKELMQLAPDKTEKMAIPLFLGKDSSGAPLIADLSGMPHCLIAGTTGSGKSVCINTVIMSIMYTQRPDRVKLILVDPKVVEMAPFKDIPHLMCPVITDAAKATGVLEWACTKMDERYELLAEAGVRNIASYNKLTPEELIEKFDPGSPEEEAKIPKKLPYLVVIIDELADLMMTSGKEVEAHIVRIAQKARAVGIHLVLATQRPQANVVTGLIKSNMPSKIAFRVNSKMDSRIVLDQNGSELLLGQGDMLFLPPGAAKPIRSQGTFIDDGEIRLSVKKVKELAEAQYEPELVQLKTGINMVSEEERDPLYDEAVRVVLETKRGSVSLLQRRLTIGYARSSRMIEQMAADGIVGDYKGSQAREATITVEEWEELRRQQLAAQEAGEADGLPGAENQLGEEDLDEPTEVVAGYDDDEPADDDDRENDEPRRTRNEAAA